MFSKNLCHRIEPFGLFVRLLVGLALSIPYPTLAENPGRCSNADLLTLNTTLRSFGDDRSCYRVDLPSSGVLTLDASAPGSLSAEPRLIFLGHLSKGIADFERYQLLLETPRGVVVKAMAPGPMFLLVESEDPAEPLDGYKLRGAFVSTGDGKDVAFDLASINSCPADNFLQVATKDVDEVDCDPWEGLLARPATAARQVGDFGLCGVEADDHGDTPLCGTEIALGNSVAGTLENAQGDDEDFFTFVVDQLRSVQIETETAHLTLYDGKGQRLATSGGGGQDARIVRTLSPGRYDARLSGARGSEDGYVLRLEVSGEM